MVAHGRAKDTSGTLSESLLSKAYSDTVCDVDIERRGHTARGGKAGGCDVALERGTTGSVWAIRRLLPLVWSEKLARGASSACPRTGQGQSRSASETHLERRDAFLRNGCSFPEVGAGKQLDLYGLFSSCHLSGNHTSDLFFQSQRWQHALRL